MPSLGDILSAAATGKNQNNLTAAYQLNAARAADTFAQVPLRGAQTEEALQNAQKVRLEAIAAQKKQDALDKIQEHSSESGYAPSLGDLMSANGGNYDQATAGMGHAQEQGFRSTLANPDADPTARLAAEAGVQGKVPNPYSALPPESVDLRALPPPGAPPNGMLSQTGQATVDLKGAQENAAKLKSTDANIDPAEIAFWAHSHNVGGRDPSFGMGQSATRNAFLRAVALDARGIPITRESLGLGAVPGAKPAAPATPGVTPGAAPLSPEDAAAKSVGQITDTKAAQTAINKNTSLITTMSAQEVTALNNYDLAMTFADKLGRRGGTFLNKALNDWNTGVKSDPDTSDFVSALSTVHDEIAKIRSGATSAQGITDAGRKAADNIIHQHMDLATLKSLRPVISTDAQNVRKGYSTAIQAARSVITNPAGGGISGAAGDAAVAAATATGTPPASMLKEGMHTKFKGDPRVWTLQNGQPTQVQ